MLLDQNVVLDVADRERALLAEKRHHLAEVGSGNRAEPGVAIAPMAAHGRNVEAEVPGRDVGERVRPVLEDGFLDRLRMPEVGAR